MKNENIIRIKPEELEMNMVLARDVVTDSGQLVVARETPARDIPKSAIEQFDYIFVRKLTGKESTGSIPIEPTPVEELPVYRNFEKLYNTNSEKTKEYIAAICSGEDVLVENICEPANKIMESLTSKSDVYAYIGAIKDNDIITHSNNVSLLCNLFGHWLNLSDEAIATLTLSGLLHDIGKTRIAPDLLPALGDVMSERQISAMRRHPQYGSSLLESAGFPEEVRLAALMHHERHDGTGYPAGLKGNQIADTAKIVQICNAYENALHGPTKNEKRCPFDIIKTFERDGYAVMDPKYLWIFLNKITSSFLGHWVELSDGQNARVFFINQHDLSRPIVQTESGDAIDLSSQDELYIKRLL